MDTMHRWLIDQFGGQIVGNELRIDCPFCSDQKMHMYISMVKPVAHCFKCDWRGTHFAFVKEYLGAESYAEVWACIKEPVSEVSSFESIADRLTGKHNRRDSHSIEDMPDWYKPFCDVCSLDTHAKLVLQYALKRLSWNNIVRYGVGVCDDPNKDQFRMRMIIPIERGYFQARTVGKGDPKYVNPKEPVGSRLFNPSALWEKDLVIAEGAISAIAIGTNTVAVLGKNVNKEQEQRIARSRAKSVTIAFDADATWCKAATDTADYLTAVGKKVLIRQYTNGDPDTCNEYFDIEYNLLQKVTHKFAADSARV